MTVQLPFDQAHPLDVAPLLRQRSEEHTSELQSQSNLVCRLLLEKKKIQRKNTLTAHSVPRCHAQTIIVPRTHATPRRAHWRRPSMIIRCDVTLRALIDTLIAIQ